MSTPNHSKSERVNSLVSYFTNGNKSEFARMLGTTPQVVATWIARDTINYDLIYAKCENINPHWLLTGEGDMILPTSIQEEESGSTATPDPAIESILVAMQRQAEELGAVRYQLQEEKKAHELTRHLLARVSGGDIDAGTAGGADSGSSALAV